MFSIIVLVLVLGAALPSAEACTCTAECDATNDTFIVYVTNTQINDQCYDIAAMTPTGGSICSGSAGGCAGGCTQCVSLTTCSTVQSGGDAMFNRPSSLRSM